MRKIKNYEQYQINEDDSSGNIIHKIYGMHHEFKPTDGIHESELNLIHEKSKDAMWAIPNINFLDDPPTELASRMHGIIMYLICEGSTTDLIRESISSINGALTVSIKVISSAITR